MKVKTFTIIRGLPGSGKTREAMRQKAKRPHDTIICSADDFFGVGDDYAANFDPSQMGQAHADCAYRVFRLFERGMPNVILANTNSQLWEYRHYEVAATIAGYGIGILEIPCPDRETFFKFHERNVHGVPQSIASAMWLRWEDDYRAVFLKEEVLK